MKKLLLLSLIMIGFGSFASAQTSSVEKAKKDVQTKEAIKKEANKPVTDASKKEMQVAASSSGARTNVKEKAVVKKTAKQTDATRSAEAVDAVKKN